MSPPVFGSDTILPELRPSEDVRRNPFLDPPDECHQSVLIGLRPRLRALILSDSPGTIAIPTMVHPANHEEAVEFVELGRGKVHSARDVCVIQLRAFWGNDVVLEAVIG